MASDSSHRAGWRQVLIFASAVLTGCATPGAPGSSPPDASPPDDGALRYTCTEDHATFTINDLMTAPAADTVDDPALAALQDVLAAGWLPMEGWRRVAQTSDEVVFIADWPNGEAPFASVNVVPGGGATSLHDGWGVDSYGACTPRPVAPEGTSVADWYVDPSAAAPGPESRSVAALVHERACASGSSAEGRIMEPEVDYGMTEVIVTILVRRAPGNQACPGNPATPFVFELDEPLGDRALRDGGRFPVGDPFHIPDGAFSPPG